MFNSEKGTYPSGLSDTLLVLLSRMIPLPVSLPNMEAENGVPTLLERPEVKQEVWLEPGMLRGEGAAEDRCWRIRLRFFTVWKTRFGCSLEWEESFDKEGTMTGLLPMLTFEFTSALLRLDRPSVALSSWFLQFLLPESPEKKRNTSTDFMAQP